MDDRIKFGDSGSNRSRDIRAAHFIMDERRRRTTAGAGHHIRQNAIRRQPIANRNL